MPVGWCRSYSTSLQWNVCLLPPLQRVHRKLMMGLVRLREAFGSATGRDPCRNRLEELFLSLHGPVTVVTLLDPAAGSEATELHGWNGSVPLPDDMILPWPPRRARTPQHSPLILPSIPPLVGRTD